MRGSKAKKLRRLAARNNPQGSTLEFKTTGREVVHGIDGNDFATPIGHLEYSDGYIREYKRLKKESK